MQSGGLNEYNTTCSIDIPAVFSVPKTQLEKKTLPEHLEYAFLEKDDQKSMSISSDLTPTEKESLVKVL